ncbi:MAG: amidohydrolase [Spirochaetes bacterium]|nr:amidohydrolase [Spirochaetota bacterium]
MKVYEGKIITCDQSGSVYKFLVEDKGRILWTGNVLPDEWSGVHKILLGEGCLVPSFADTHNHFMSHALFSGGLDIRPASSNAEAAEMTVRYEEKSREKITLGFGASEYAVSEKKMITRSELDRVLPAKPVFIVKYDGHAGVINSALLKMLPDSIRTMRGYEPDSGLMTQEAFYKVTDFVTATVSLPDTLKRMLRAADKMAEKGIALIHSCTGVGFPGDMDVTLESVFAKGLRNKIDYRVFFQTMDIKKIKKRSLPRVGGCFATALDGCFGSADAAMNSAYRNSSDKGVLYYSDETVIEFAKQANRTGLQIEMHAIGDRAFDQAVLAISSALKDFPRKDHRHAIIHSCLITDKGLKTCAKLGIAMAVQPSFIHWDQEPLSYLKKIMGDRADRLNPLKTIHAAGVRMSGGSDAPCTVPDPVNGIWAACNHYNKSESLTVQQALNLFTIDAAWMSFDEKEKGSLETGKKADMVILDKDILSYPKGKIRDIKVSQLIVSGNVYKPGQGRIDVIRRGLFSSRKI